MPVQYEEKLEISFDITCSQPHTVCDQKHCISQGGEVCISKEFKEHLKTSNRIDQSLTERYIKKKLDHQLIDQYLSSKTDEHKNIKPEFQKNDLQWLCENDANIMKIFSDPKVYRLRFKEHDKHACEFITQIFQFYQKTKLQLDGKYFIDCSPNNPEYQELVSTLSNQLFRNTVLWGSDLKNNVMPSYERSFLYLCENARKRSAKQKRPFKNKSKDVTVFILKGEQRSTFLLSCH